MVLIQKAMRGVWTWQEDEEGEVQSKEENRELNNTKDERARLTTQRSIFFVFTENLTTSRRLPMAQKAEIARKRRSQRVRKGGEEEAEVSSTKGGREGGRSSEDELTQRDDRHGY